MYSFRYKATMTGWNKNKHAHKRFSIHVIKSSPATRCGQPMMGSIGSSFGSGYFISASGLMDASLRLDVASHNIANSNTDGFIPDQVTSIAQSTGGVGGMVVLGNAGMLEAKNTPSQTDYATEGINLLLAKHAFQANAQALKTQIQSERSLLNVFG
jgi:flagellar hook protein FlgE